MAPTLLFILCLSCYLVIICALGFVDIFYVSFCDECL